MAPRPQMETELDSLLHNRSGMMNMGSTFMLSSSSNKNKVDAMSKSGRNMVTGRRSINRVSYTPSNHLQILIQMYGSALPQVLPFCIVNCIWTIIVACLRNYEYIDITMKSSTGHTFMGLLVSFLVVERSRISYSRFMENRFYLADCYRTCRELIQLGCAYTYKSKTELAMKWRQDFAYRVILLLRVTMDTLEWASTHRNEWEIKYDKAYKKDESEHVQALREFTHGDRTLIDENLRATLMFEYTLRETIMSHEEHIGYKLHANEYRDLILLVSEFNKAFHGFRVLTLTPYPFPLVQMTRMFLFFWVYSLPLVLVDQMGALYNSLLMVFLITFGFIGIEYVSMTLDDPFGHDVNDVDQTGMSELVFEDVYLTIYKVDGLQAARNVKKRVMQRYALGRGLECYHHDFRSDDFWQHKTVHIQPLIQRNDSMPEVV